MPPQRKSKTPQFECTACRSQITSIFNANLHPLIDCLICRDCYQTYADGDFENWEEGVDEDGDDNYCRWCCDGGDLFGCMSEVKCHYCFCKDCIKRNVPDDPVLKLDGQGDDFKWKCYSCDKTKLKPLHEKAREAYRILTDLSKKKQASCEITSGEIKRRISVFRRTKDICKEEIDDKFDKLFEIFLNGSATKRQVDLAIEGLRRPFLEFETIVTGLKRISNSIRE